MKRCNCQHKQSWATATWKVAPLPLPLFDQKSSGAAVYRCRLPLLVYESSAATAVASECKSAGAAAIYRKKSQKHKGILIF